MKNVPEKRVVCRPVMTRNKVNLTPGMVVSFEKELSQELVDIFFLKKCGWDVHDVIIHTIAKSDWDDKTKFKPLANDLEVNDWVSVLKGKGRRVAKVADSDGNAHFVRRENLKQVKVWEDLFANVEVVYRFEYKSDNGKCFYIECSHSIERKLPTLADNGVCWMDTDRSVPRAQYTGWKFGQNQDSVQPVDLSGPTQTRHNGWGSFRECMYMHYHNFRRLDKEILPNVGRQLEEIMAGRKMRVDGKARFGNDSCLKGFNPPNAEGIPITGFKKGSRYDGSPDMVRLEDESGREFNVDRKDLIGIPPAIFPWVKEE